MDPVTAFSLAAGILQVVDISFKALKQCRELYKDGSLAEHRDTIEVTDALGWYTLSLLSTSRFYRQLCIVDLVFRHKWPFFTIDGTSHSYFSIYYVLSKIVT